MAKESNKAPSYIIVFGPQLSLVFNLSLMQSIRQNE